MTETLTEAEIDCLRTWAYEAGEKALRIIDAHAATARAATELARDIKGFGFTFTISVQERLDAHANAPAVPTWKCGACRDTGKWSNGIDCPGCQPSPAAPTRSYHGEVRQHDGHAWVRLDSLRSTRTDHERAVLDACRNAVTRVAHMGREVLQLTQGSQQTIAEAVVAWREARGESTRIHDAERAVLRIVRQCCQDSRTWMQANLPALFAADEALARREGGK